MDTFAVRSSPPDAAERTVGTEGALFRWRVTRATGEPICTVEGNSLVAAVRTLERLRAQGYQVHAMRQPPRGRPSPEPRLDPEPVSAAGR